MSQPLPRPAPGRYHCPACGRLVGATGDVSGVLGADGRTRRFVYLRRHRSHGGWCAQASARVVDLLRSVA